MTSRNSAKKGVAAILSLSSVNFAPLGNSRMLCYYKKEKQNNGRIARACYFQTRCIIFWRVILLQK